jgi:hypothetical protein
MKKRPGSLEALMDALRCLPGVGPKSAQRMAYHLLQHDREGADTLGHAILHALNKSITVLPVIPIPKPDCAKPALIRNAMPLCCAW